MVTKAIAKKPAQRDVTAIARTRVKKPKPEETENPLSPKLSAVEAWQRGIQERRIQNARLRAKKAKAPGPKKSPALMAEMCRRIAENESVASICDDPAMPSRTNFYKWVTTDEAWKDAYSEALRARGEATGELMNELALEATLAPPELTNAYRLAVDAMKWTAARLLPMKYGDRVVHSGDSENPLVTKHIVDADDLLDKIKGAGK